MSRLARTISESGVYHILFRGVNQQNIFEETADFNKLKETILIVDDAEFSRGVMKQALLNAGFDNIGAYSLQEYVHDPLVNLVITTLIILGGIGFSVWFDVTHNVQSIIKNKCRSGWKRSYRMLKIHTRLI